MFFVAGPKVWLQWILLGLGLGLTSICQSQTSSPGRLPQDAARNLEPVPREISLAIDRERYAEQAPAGADGLMFRLTSIELVGNHATPTAQLEPFWADLVGHEIPLSAVFEVAAKISAAYRDAGYVLSQALIPRQDITQADGRVRIRIVEGFIGRISIADDVLGAEHIRELLAPITAERPLTLAALERYLLLVNDLPGVRARASLRAGDDAGSADLELVVARESGAGSLAAHNRTGAAVGPVRIEAEGVRRALFGEFDQHSLRWVGSGNDRLNLLAYSATAPLDRHGLNLSWSLSASRSKPEVGEVFQFDTNSAGASIGLGYPVMRSRSSNLSVRIALAAYNGSSDILAGLFKTEERLRTVSVGLSGDISDSLGGINLMDIELDQGLSGMGASRRNDAQLARFGSNPQFTKVTLYAARLQSLGGEWSMLAAVTAQGTDDLLTSSEQFGLGGDIFLRAYDPSELLGDSGSAGKLELRYNMAWSNWSATSYAFYEGGSVRLRSASGPTSTTSALSGGLGLRVSGPRGLRGYLELAKPWNRATASNGDQRLRVFGGIGVDF